MTPFGPPLPAAFYRRTADRLAPDLLGKILVVHGAGGGMRAGRIVEVEAYVGEADLACHAAKGRTARTRTLYGPAGTAYVYLVYGMHELFNVVAAAVGEPHAVLVRAAELLLVAGEPDGDDADGGAADGGAAHGGAADGGAADGGAPSGGDPDRARADGPGRLTRALGIDRRFDGADITRPPLTLHDGPPPSEIVVTPRVGVGYAGAWADAALRFLDPGSAAVSRPPRSAIGRPRPGTTSGDPRPSARRTPRAASG